MAQKYIALSWPDYQEYMEEEWFMRESYYDYNENVYLIPINRVNTTSIGYKCTKLWKVNGKLIISDTVEEAIKLYKLWAIGLDKPTDIISVKTVGDDQIPENYDVLILDVK